MNAGRVFANHLVNTRFEQLPAAAVEAAKIEVMDSLATALGGSRMPGVPELEDIVREWGGAEQSTVFAYGTKCPAPNAAQVNGTMIHALDYDDGHPVALVHIGCVAVSTCFAVAERMGKTSGKDFITALALGGDFESRMGLASKPGSSAMGGWHPTTLFGFLGSAGMAGRLMELDEERMVNALGLAYHQCGGAGTGVGDGALAKRMGPGLAAKGGVTAAFMAERGITGDTQFLGGAQGRGGLYNTYYRGDFDANVLTADLGKHFENVNIGFKPYPCCGFTHPFIDATLALRSKYSIKPEQVREIEVTGGMQPYGMSIGEAKTAPRTIVDAQFSVPWTVGTALLNGAVTLENFSEEGIKNKDISAVAKKVTAKLDESMNRHGVGPGRVKMTMNDGAEHTNEVEDFLGSIKNPIKFDDCARKFRECAPLSVHPLSSSRTERVIELVRHLEQLDDVREVVRSLC